jgi:GDPmannose 4,6-dehydratase
MFEITKRTKLSSQKTALIFGASGQDGYYMNKLLTCYKIITKGISRSGNFIKGDVGNREFVKEIIRSTKPTYIFNFAANSTVEHTSVFENHDTISTGVLNILEAVYQYSPNSKVFVSGSGLQFLNSGDPISENSPFDAKDAYSASRISSVYYSRYYRNLGLKVYIGYFFNHESPLRSSRHINKKIVIAAKQISAGETQYIEIGDIMVKKEFTYAKDSVFAAWILINNDQVFEAVIGSGIAYSIKDWLEICFQYYNLNWKNHIKVIPNYKSPYKILISDPSTIKSLGWHQTINFNELALIFLTE